MNIREMNVDLDWVKDLAENIVIARAFPRTEEAEERLHKDEEKYLYATPGIVAKMIDYIYELEEKCGVKNK